jgi:hypothetical protein
MIPLENHILNKDQLITLKVLRGTILRTLITSSNLHMAIVVSVKIRLDDDDISLGVFFLGDPRHGVSVLIEP